MADGLIVALEEFKTYLGPEAKLGSDRDDELTAFILAAEEAVRGKCAQNFDQRAYVSELHDGKGKPYIWSRQKPVAVSPLPVVTENGANLKVAAGYSSSADVVFNPSTGAFARQGAIGSCGWAKGAGNISLSYTGGFPTPPPDLKLLIKWVAAYTWKTTDGKQFAVKRRSGQQGNTEFWEDLPQFYQTILTRYAVQLHGE